MAEHKTEYNTVTAVVLRTTDKAALLVLPETDQQVWVPRSVIENGADVVVSDSTDNDGEQDLHIATWFCEKEGID